MNNDQRYPLRWPPGRPRTPAEKRTRSPFHRRTTVENGVGGSYRHKAAITMAGAKGILADELARIGARGVVISTNIELNRNGEPRADRKPPSDPGVAVYLTLDGRELAFACDRWAKVEENIRAIAKTIEAIRGIERWGSGDMVAAAFTGFTELPAHVPPAPWYVVMGLDKDDDEPDRVKNRYRALAIKHHPDRNGGDDAAMKELNRAYDAYKKEKGIQ